MNMPEQIVFVINGDKAVRVNPFPYLYAIQTWGGFYNEEHREIHRHEPGVRYFHSDAARSAYLKELKEIEQALDAKHLANTKAEGFKPYVETPIVLHRITRHEGVDYYTTYKVSGAFGKWDFSTAWYHMEEKWFPGWNDYPMGEDFDYERKDYEIVDEWVTGAFRKPKGHSSG